MAKNTTETTVIAQGVRVEGDMVSQGDIHIEGELQGSIQAQGDLRIGSTAKIQANVRVKNAHISGELHGNLEVEDKLELTESAVIVGDVITKVLSVSAGAQVNGTLTMGDLPMTAKEPMLEDEDELEEDEA